LAIWDPALSLLLLAVALGLYWLLATPDGTMIPVGPDGCLFGPSRAFDQFHFNFHLGTPNFDAFRQPNNPVSFVAPVPCA
jgi:hypothetical protein